MDDFSPKSLYHNLNVGARGVASQIERDDKMRYDQSNANPCASGTLLEHTANATSDFWLSCGIICVRRVDFDDVDKCINAWIREQIFVRARRALSIHHVSRNLIENSAARAEFESRDASACGESFSFIRKRQAGSSGASRPIHRVWISKVRDAQNLIDRALGALFMRTNLLWFICFVSYCVFWGGNIIFLTRIIHEWQFSVKMSLFLL
jgi:hypothetical protein